MKKKIFSILFLTFIITTGTYSQKFSEFESLFKEIPKTCVFLSPNTNFENEKLISNKYGSMLQYVDTFATKLYALYKIKVNKEYSIFIIGRNGMYTESGERFILMQLYDVKNKKFSSLNNLTMNSSDEGYSTSRSSFIADINGDGFFDILELYDSYKYSNKNKHNYSSKLYFWQNNEFVPQQ